MTIKKTLVGMFLVILILTMTGCLSYSEETWFNENGSGKLQMEIGISEALLSMSTGENGQDPFSLEKIKKGFKANKHVKLISSKTFTKDGNKIIQLGIEFKSLSSLEAWMNHDNKSGDPGFLGQTSMRKNKKGQIIYSRVISFNTGTSNKTDESSVISEQMTASLFANYVWHYTVHFPYKVISANTADDYIDHKTNTVKWDFALASLAKKPQTMRVVLRPYNFFESILHKLHLYN